MSHKMGTLAEAFYQSKNQPANQQMNVWWFSQYASTPDQQFTTQYDLAKRLVQNGHRITLFAAGFSHYKFKEIRLRPAEQWRVDEYEGVRFVWLRTPPYRANDWRRAINICSYAWRAYRLARSWSEKPDVIIGTTFHPLASLSAYAVSVSKKKPFVFEVKDLWPLTMVEFGRLSPNSPVAFALKILEKFLSRRATKIMTTLPGAAKYYSKLGIPAEKTVWIPNGLELPRYAALRPYTGETPDAYVFLYAGGHVYANALETILRAAQIVQKEGAPVRFVFVGGGQEKPKLLQTAQELELRNVEFRDSVPKSELYRIMEEADAFIISMRDLPQLYRYGISFNKLCDYVASGRPILFAGNPSFNVVEEYQCGIIIPPENPQAFAAAIQKFLSMTPEQRAEMGKNGLRCAKERFDMATLADRLEKMLLTVVGESRLAGNVVNNRHVVTQPHCEVD